MAAGDYLVFSYCSLCLFRAQEPPGEEVRKYMPTWSGTRAKLEKEYLAESLRGHIQYFATSYSKCPDHEGRAAIMLDGKEIIQDFLQLQSNFLLQRLHQTVMLICSMDAQNLPMPHHSLQQRLQKAAILICSMAVQD